MGKLEKVTNGALILVCLTMTADVVYRRLRPPVAPPPQGQPGQGGAAEYKVGEAFPALPGYSLAADKRSLVLVVKETCKYFTASMPFYHRLAQTVREQGGSVSLVGVCPDPTDVCAAYLKRHDIAVERAIGVAQGTLKVAGTPTLLLIEQGKGASVWRGQLPPRDEDEVLAAVRKSSVP